MLQLIPLFPILTQGLLIFACTVLAGACLVGVFNDDFPDTTLQRAGLALVGSGAIVVLWQTAMGNAADRATTLIVVGGAVYAGGTVFSNWKRT
jgi:uncharacterized protein YjeT (DUF2065 family)